MKQILQSVLTFFAKLNILRFQPVIIAVTGSVGKTSTKEAISAALGKKFFVRAASGNLNNELGVPLTILGDFAREYYTDGPTIWFWLKVIAKSAAGLIKSGKYPKILVLEYGADRPGDIRKLVSDFKPHISVLTSIGEIPPHVEFFESPEALTREKSAIVTSLGKDDFAILNADDDRVLKIIRGATLAGEGRPPLEAKVLTYGFNKTADILISELGISVNDENIPQGINFRLGYGGLVAPVAIHGSLGYSHAFAAAAGAAVGLTLGMSLAEVCRDLGAYRGANGRLKILKGVKNSIIIDDTYNSSPAAAKLALETLKHLPAERKVAILGDMLELGEFTETAHREIGEIAGRTARFLITVGARAKFMADAAVIELGQDKVVSYDSVGEAGEKIIELIKPKDVILVKGSQGMRLEKIVAEIMTEQDKKSELLVRQSKKWLEK